MEKYHVTFSEDAMRCLLLETARHPGKESLSLLPGVRIGSEFYFDLAADSGIRAIYEYAMCEKDRAYTDHLANCILELYDVPRERVTVSQIHKHPPGCDRFSEGDRPSNLFLAKRYHGCVNGLILVDPVFRLKLWYIDEEGRETPVEYCVDSAAAARALPRKALEGLRSAVEQREAQALGGRRTAPPPVPEQEEHRKTLRETVRNWKKTHRKKEKKMEQPIREEALREDFPENWEDLREYCVLLPREYREEGYEGLLRGYWIENTRTFNVLTDAAAAAHRDALILGEAHRREALPLPREGCAQETLSIAWEGSRAAAVVAGHPEAEVELELYTLEADLFSRNQGILEPTRMKDKQVIVVGLGSGGFEAAEELVRAGIGSVIAVDDDVLQYQNLSRHACGIRDVGRFKTDLFCERAADINPACQVHGFHQLLQHVDPAELDRLVWKKSVILCCADARHGAYVCSELAEKRYRIPMVDAGCGVRASTAEIFWYRPDSGLATYREAFGEDRGVDYANRAVRRAYYATERELEKLDIQPGLGLDIKNTVLFQVKLAIDLLMEGEEGYQPMLLPWVRQYSVLLNRPVDPEVNPYMKVFGDRAVPMTWKTFAAGDGGREGGDR